VYAQCRVRNCSCLRAGASSQSPWDGTSARNCLNHTTCAPNLTKSRSPEHAGALASSWLCSMLVLRPRWHSHCAYSHTTPILKPSHCLPHRAGCAQAAAPPSCSPITGCCLCRPRCTGAPRSGCWGSCCSALGCIFCLGGPSRCGSGEAEHVSMAAWCGLVRVCFGCA